MPRITYKQLAKLIAAYEKNPERPKWLRGGKARNKLPSAFSVQQLYKGVNTELEHTTIPGVALVIVMDHLVEDPQYYTKLIKCKL